MTLKLEDVIHRVKTKNSNIEFIDTFYVNNTYKHRFLEKDTDIVFTSEVKSILNGSVYGSPETKKKRTLNSLSKIVRKPAKLKYSYMDVQNRINIYTNKTTIVEDTFKGMHINCKFIDKEYGEFMRRPDTMLYRKTFRHPYHENLKVGKKRLTSFEEAYNRLISFNILLDKDSYVGISKKCKMWEIGIDEPFFSKPGDVLRGDLKGHPNKSLERSRETCIKRYGVDAVSKVREIRLKGCRSSNNIKIVNHWKTNEELVCKASYEYKTVLYLNKNKIDFVWQPKSFKLSNNITYNPDIYIKDYLFGSRKYFAEVKGYFYPKSKLKWEEFKSKYTTAQLWDTSFLKENGIL